MIWLFSLLFVLNNDIAFYLAITLDRSIIVGCGGVCVGFCGRVFGGVFGGVCGVGDDDSDGDSITIFDIFNCFLWLNPVVCLRLRLGKSHVLFVRVTSYIVSTTTVEMISAVTVIDGDLRQSVILFESFCHEKIIIENGLV